MFLYKISSVDKLLSIVKSREQILNDPNLCKLLESPLLKDDTELAIHYKEYQLGYPDAGKKFVDYFYTHGPELDVGTLDEWRDIILNDPDLYKESLRNNLELGEIWAEKQNDDSGASYAWLGALADCLAHPCSYTNPISPVIGIIGDSTSKYSLKNTKQDDAELVSTGLPAFIVNKIPKALTQGCIQLVNMISEQTADVAAIASREKSTAKEDQFILSDAELIGGDILADIASRMGDCFRLYEKKRRYNPYDYSQNQEKADREGHTVTDKKGVKHNVSPIGNAIQPVNRAKVNSDNNILKPKTNAKEIIKNNIQDMDDEFLIDIEVTVYNSALTADGVLYSDSTKDKNSQVGRTASDVNTSILPNDVSVVNRVGRGETSKQEFTPEYDQMMLGVATRDICVVKYYTALFKKLYGDKKSIPDNLKELAKKGYKKGGLYCKLKFPNGTRIFEVVDTGRSSSPNTVPWADITAQFFMVPENQKLGTLYAKDKTAVNKGAGVAWPPPKELMMLAKAAPTELSGFSIANNTNKKNIIKGMYFFSEDFCITNGLDPSIFADMGAAPLITPKS